MDDILTPDKISRLMNIAKMNTPNLELLTKNNRGIFKSFLRSGADSKSGSTDCKQGEGHVASPTGSVVTVADSSLGLLDMDSSFSDGLSQSKSKEYYATSRNSLPFIPTELSGRSTAVDVSQQELADLQSKMRAQTETVNRLVRESNAAELFSGFNRNSTMNPGDSMSNECFRTMNENDLSRDELSFARNAPDHTINDRRTDAEFSRLNDQSKMEPWMELSMGSYFQQGVQNLREILKSPMKSEPSSSIAEDTESSPELQPVRGPPAILVEDSMSDSSLSISLIAKCLGKMDVESTPSVLLMEAKKNKKETNENSTTSKTKLSSRKSNITDMEDGQTVSLLSEIQNLVGYKHLQNYPKPPQVKSKKISEATANNSEERSCYIVDNQDVISIDSSVDYGTENDQVAVIDVPDLVTAYIGMETAIEIKLHSLTDRLQEIKLIWHQDNITLLTLKTNHQILMPKSTSTWNSCIVAHKCGTATLKLGITINDLHLKTSMSEMRSIQVEVLLPPVKILNPSSAQLDFPMLPECGLAYKPVLLVSGCAESIPVSIICESRNEAFSVVCFDLINTGQVNEALNATYRGVDPDIRSQSNQANIVFCEIEQTVSKILQVTIPGNKAGQVLRVIVQVKAPHLESLEINDDGFASMEGKFKVLLASEYTRSSQDTLSSLKICCSVGLHKLFYKSSSRIANTNVLLIKSGDDTILKVCNQGSLSTKVTPRVLREDGTSDQDGNFLIRPSFVTLDPGDEDKIHIQFKGKKKVTRTLVLEDVVTATQCLWTLLGNPMSNIQPVTSSTDIIPLALSPSGSETRGRGGSISVEDGRFSANESGGRFPLRTSTHILSWSAVRVGSASTQSVRLQNAGSRAHRVRVMVRNDAIPPGFALAPGTPCEFRLAAGEIRLLHVQFQPMHSGAQIARLVFSTVKDERHQRNMLLLGTGGAGQIGWGADVCRGTGAALLPLAPGPQNSSSKPVFTASLSLVNKGDAPAYFFTNLAFTWQFRDAKKGTRVEPELGILAPREEQRIKITVQSAVVNNTKDVLGAYLAGTVTVLTGDAASCARAGSLLLAGAKHPHRDSLLPRLSPAPNVAFCSMPLLQTFSDSKDSLEMLLGDLSELTAHLTLASDAVMPSLYSDTTDDTCDSNLDDDDDDVTLRFRTLASDTLLLSDRK